MGGGESKSDSKQMMDVGGQHITNLSGNSDLLTIGVLVMTILKIMEIMIFAYRCIYRRMTRFRRTCGNCQQQQQQPPV